MRPRTIWIIVACIILLPALLLVIAAEWLFGVTELLYKPIRYRVATSVELIDHSTLRRSVANSDCWALVATRGMVRGIRKSRKGEDNHAVLGDGSILILPDLDPCRWIDAKPAPGTSYVLMPPNAPISLSPPSGRGSGTAQSTAELRPGEAWRFDSVNDPTSVTIYQLTALL